MVKDGSPHQQRVDLRPAQLPVPLQLDRDTPDGDLVGAHQGARRRPQAVDLGLGHATRLAQRHDMLPVSDDAVGDAGQSKHARRQRRPSGR